MATRGRAPALRTRDVLDPRAQEAFRDIDDYMRGTLQVTAHPEFDALYTEPFHLTLVQEPLGLLCIRVRKVPELETALIAGGVCPFVWDGKDAVISKVPGLTAGTTQKYRFNFVVVG